ncbi:hypothetical protein [Erwinia billingiae]|uniref:hypothetical protein n=1 Tax=Erwinia billingiae TaxID=182337 RepID=UPI0021573B26|nr:hypothetical protein [Erwinia billingiae]
MLIVVANDVYGVLLMLFAHVGTGEEVFDGMPYRLWGLLYSTFDFKSYPRNATGKTS